MKTEKLIIEWSLILKSSKGGGIKTLLESDKKENKIYLNLWNKRQAKGKLIAMNAFIKKSEIPNKRANHAPQALRKTRKSQTKKQGMEKNIKDLCRI